MKKDQISETYNEMFVAGGAAGVYDLPYNISPYYPMYKKVLFLLKKLEANNVLEVGCGTGAFAKMIFDRTKIHYAGFDFSDVAIDKAKKKLGDAVHFYKADATLQSSYKIEYDTIVCTEVLEHLIDDLSVIDKWKKGALCVCSVPNYDSVYHTRFFKDADDVLGRYGDKINISKIYKVKKPVLNDLTFSNYIKQLRWNRYRPNKLVEILGFGKFDDVGGWFIFVGRKI
jgi:2-polyprenyl-3-methyl-5-hydroxy-6-metoxy-1,4-benzoquinol methylase